MSANRYVPHIHVLPEDDANRQIANGFLLDESLFARRFHVLEEAGGWHQVVERFLRIYASQMEQIPKRLMILLIDCDQHPERQVEVKEQIPGHLRERVFVLGVLSNPEELRKDLGSLESIGLGIARDCREGTGLVWNHRLLRHNAGEVGRLTEQAKPILFPSI